MSGTKKQISIDRRQMDGLRKFTGETKTIQFKKESKIAKHQFSNLAELIEKRRIFCENEITTTPFRKIDEDMLKLITHSFVPKDKKSISIFQQVFTSMKHNYSMHSILTSRKTIPEKSHFSEIIHTHRLYRTIQIPTFRLQEQLKVVWDSDIRKYLDKHKKASQIITKVVEKVLEYGDTVSIFTGVRIRFLKDPDDSNPVILIEVQTGKPIDYAESFDYKRKMRSMLTVVAKEFASNKQEYIKLRAGISLILREG